MSKANSDPLSLSNLSRPEFRADPYPLYARLRAEDPVHWDDGLGYWVLTRYADVEFAYRDPRFSRAKGLQGSLNRLPEGERQQARPVYDMLGKTMTYSDPPYHRHLRGLANKAFTPRAVEQMRSHIQDITDQLLDNVQPNREMCLIRDLAFPLPIMVITEMLGLSSEERSRFKEWSDDIFNIMGVTHYSPELMQKANESVDQATEYIDQLGEQRRQNPKNDLLSGLIAAEEEGSCLTHEELVANVVLLLGAGHETTTNLIGNGTLALLRHPEQMEKLRANPELVDTTIEEMLRYDNPVHITYRSPTEDLEIGGKQIRKGQIVNSIIAAANRDPEQFSQPDRFDITRDEGRHLGFGLGIHFCLGAPLARLESQIAFNTLLRRFPNLQLAADELTWQDHPSFRSLNSLPVTF